MAQKEETRFRANTVKPFLKTLRNTLALPIQQLTLVGDPDFVLCSCGKFVALELKRQGGKVTELQAYKLAEVKRTGGVAIVASPDNWLWVKSLLEALDRGEEIWESN